MYYVDASDGAKLAVEDININSNKVVVMVHGWPLCKEMYEYQKNILINKGFRIISFDLRGFGKSQVSSSGYDYNQLATDLKSIIDSLNVENVYLIGFSMGGAICIHYMSLFDNYKVEKLVLIGAAAPSFVKNENNPYGNPIEKVNSLINQAYNDRPQMVKDFGSNVFALNHSNSFKNWFNDLALSASGVGTIKTAISLRDENIFKDLSKIKVPTAIMHGRLDKVCPYGLALIMNNQIPNSKLYTFEYSGHGLFYDELRKFNHDLLEFLK